MSDDFDEPGYWAKINRHAQRAGRELVEKSLWLYYAAQSPETPAWAKSAVYGALAYFLLPFDAIPDFLPAVGFTDDLGTIAAAVASVAMYIDDDIKERAAAKLTDWFGPTNTQSERGS